MNVGQAVPIGFEWDRLVFATSVVCCSRCLAEPRPFLLIIFGLPPDNCRVTHKKKRFYPLKHLSLSFFNSVALIMILSRFVLASLCIIDVYSQSFNNKHRFFVDTHIYTTHTNSRRDPRVSAFRRPTVIRARLRSRPCQHRQCGQLNAPPYTCRYRLNHLTTTSCLPPVVPKHTIHVLSFNHRRSDFMILRIEENREREFETSAHIFTKFPDTMVLDWNCQKYVTEPGRPKISGAKSTCTVPGILQRNSFIRMKQRPQIFRILLQFPLTKKLQYMSGSAAGFVLILQLYVL